ncbi:AhpA/YtjB family protein [Aliiglaciecola sp. LCG003]|uniref:AhpA/YtjB family protein n=1 Tax=Aliiglaciecola sp. LCG003 TaxID=3053655 RepID=UPI00257429A8|nr:AhpA/YtjB family protein [Aliiglaciecola sp. LCG003]WJG10498.1 AhpA/YtjB family protein [Aliiglaciecola sp. LCG003]
MDMLKNGVLESHPNRPSNYSILKRIINLVLVIATAAFCVNLWLLNTGQAQAWYEKQSGQMGKSLSSYAAKMIAIPLGQQDHDEIKNQLNLLLHDPYVTGAAVFDQQGKIIDSTEQNSSILSHFLLSQDIPLVFIAEIKNDDKVIGYLRLILAEKEVMLLHDEYQLQLYKQLLALMMLAGFAGLLVTRAYYKFRFRNHQKQAR